jgi:alkylation response protein AidB-like acyl-CoA dehydrogenase
MDFELSVDDLALQHGIAELCRRRFGIARVRAMEQTGAIDRTMWRELAEAGVFSLRLPEDQGGVGLGFAQAAIVFEQLGRALIPGPLVGTHLAAGLGLGEEIVGLVERAPPPVRVEHLDSLDQLVVIDSEGVWVANAREVHGSSVSSPLDPLTPMSVVAELPRGEQASADAQQWRLEGSVLTAAFQLGLATAVTERAVSYAKERRQFDRAIGSFQAVKHLCADMLVRSEVARAAVYAAAVTLDDPETGDPIRAAGTASILANDAALANGKACIQVHGGMGFTWEVDVHLYLKRAAVLATHFGTNDEHADVMAGYL